MTYKNLMDELNGVAVSDYKEIIDFIQDLKARKSNPINEAGIVGLVDWSKADENWNEKEIW